MPEEKTEAETKQKPERFNPFFRLVIVSAGFFVVTILAITATIFGETNSPVPRFLIRHAGTLITVEVLVTLVAGLLALAVDRRFILEDDAHNSPTASQSADSKPEPNLQGKSEL